MSKETLKRFIDMIDDEDDLKTLKHTHEVIKVWLECEEEGD